MKQVLIVLSEYGYWREELIGPIEALNEGAIDRFLSPRMEKGVMNLKAR